MKEWGLTIASEKKMRIVASELIGDNLEAELAPMSFNHKDGGEVIKEVPLVYIPRLWEKIESLLNQSSDDTRG
jgi:hypothetical protein